MKKSSRYIALTAAVLVLFGCTQEEILPQNDGKEVPITLSKVEVEGTVTTRATTTLLEEGSVGLFVKDTDVPDDSKYNAQNCHFEYENGEWKFVAEDSNPRPIYNYSELLGFSMQCAWAYSPYVADIDNAPAIELQVTQTAESIAAQEKYLFTPSSERVGESGSVIINFRHALSKVRVVVNKILPEDVAASSIASVTLGNILDKTAWDFTLDKAIGLKAPDDAVYTATTTMYKVSDTAFEAVVLPCEKTGSFNITLETTDGRQFTASVNYPNHANKDGFQSNYIYNVPVVVGVERISIGTVTVEDWNDGGTIDAPTATEPEATYSISGTSATITVPEYASAASVQAAAQAALAEKSDITYLVVNGALTKAQQNALAEGLAGAEYLEEVTLTDVPLASITPAVAALYSTVACDDFKKVVSSDGNSIVQGGSVGDNATYTLYYGKSTASMTLNIDGTGAMNDFEYYTPWSDYNIYITTVNIANGITSIGEIAFYNCVITSVTIPESVTNINDLAFADCSQLMTVICKSANPPTLGLDILKNIEGFTIYVPAESVDTYKYKWSAYADIIQPIQ